MVVGGGSISKAIEIQMKSHKGNGCNQKKKFQMIEVGKLLKKEKITHIEMEKNRCKLREKYFHPTTVLPRATEMVESPIENKTEPKNAYNKPQLPI